jgi:uncharacterized protein HemY
MLHLTNLGRACFNAGRYEDAVQTFRFALSCGSQKNTDYTWLAKSYLALDRPEQISSLITEINAGDHPRKSSLVQELQTILAGYR